MQISRSNRCRARTRRRGCDWPTFVHDSSSWFHRQAAIRNNGIWKLSCYGGLWERLETRHDCTPPYLSVISGPNSLSFVQREEALNMVSTAIAAGIFNDLGSGSNVDACVITASHTEMLRNFVKPNERVQKEKRYVFRRGTTAWKKEEIRSLIVSEEVTPVEAMDTTWILFYSVHTQRDTILLEKHLGHRQIFEYSLSEDSVKAILLDLQIIYKCVNPPTFCSAIVEYSRNSGWYRLGWGSQLSMSTTAVISLQPLVTVYLPLRELRRNNKLLRDTSKTALRKSQTYISWVEVKILV